MLISHNNKRKHDNGCLQGKFLIDIKKQKINDFI